MTHRELSNILASPEKLRSEHLPELLQLSEQYPYAASLHLLILLALHKEGNLHFSIELHNRAPFIPDLGRLFMLLKEHPATILDHPMQEEHTRGESTSDIINSFLEEHPADTSELDYLFSTPQPKREEATGSEEETCDIIATFLSKGKEAEKIELKEESPTPQEPKEDFVREELFTETLARIYIRQGKYERARNILEQIDLEFPKNNGYFAEQISFLNRLIENGKQKE